MTLTLYILGREVVSLYLWRDKADGTEADSDRTYGTAHSPVLDRGDDLDPDTRLFGFGLRRDEL